MSLMDCLGKIKEYIKESGLEDKISKARIEYFAKRLDTLDWQSMTDTEFAEKTKDLIEKDLAREQAANKSARAMSLLKREQNLSDMKFNKDLWSSDTKFGDPDKMAVEAARVAQQGGSPRQGRNTRNSIAMMGDNIRKDILTKLEQSVKEVQGLEMSAKSGALDSDGLLELDSIDRNTGGMKTGNEQAREWAKVLKSFRDNIFQMRQAASPYVDEAENFLWKQMHDRERIEAMGKDAWTKLIMEKAGNKSFPDSNVQQKNAIFRDIYDKITTGKWGSVFDDLGDGNGPNIARRMGESRQIQFNDAQSFADYNSQAGPKTLYEGMMKIADQASHDLSMMQKWGPNPEATRNATLKRFGQTLEGNQLNLFKEAMKPGGTLDQQWNVVKGSQYAPAYGTQAKFVKGAMTWQYLSKAMGAIFRSQQDLTMGAALLKTFDGSNLFSNQIQLAAKYASYLFSSEGRHEMMAHAGMFADSVQRQLMLNLGSPDSEPGTMSKLAQLGGKLSFNTAHHESITAAVADLLTKRLGDMADVRHADLPEAFKTGLLNYGIDEHAWNIIRLGTEDVGGTRRITPEGVQALPDDAHENYLRKSGQFNGQNSPSSKMLNSSRTDLSTKLGTAINENSSLASARADTRQKDFMWGDTNINQGWGQLRRMMWEFKSAALISADVSRRAYYAGDTMMNRYSAVAQYMVAGASAFIVGDVMKQLSQNKTPEGPSLNYTGKVLMGSGVGGVYLDTLVDAMKENSIKDKFGEFAKSAMGPIPSEAITAGMTAVQGASEMMGRTRGKSTAIPEAINLGLGNIPGQNLFWTKAVFDYAIANTLREMASPGHRYYAERRLRMNGQKHLVGE